MGQINRLMSLTFTLRGDGDQMALALSVAPQTFVQTEPAKINVVETDGGAYVDRFGPAVVSLHLSGTTGWKERTVNGQQMSGMEEFRQLRSLFRDYQQRVLRARQEHRAAEASLTMLNAEEGEYWIVEPANFVGRRTEHDPLLWYYEIDLRLTSMAQREPPADPLMEQLADEAAKLQAQLEALTELEADIEAAEKSMSVWQWAKKILVDDAWPARLKAIAQDPARNLPILISDALTDIIDAPGISDQVAGGLAVVRGISRLAHARLQYINSREKERIEDVSLAEWNDMAAVVDELATEWSEANERAGLIETEDATIAAADQYQTANRMFADDNLATLAQSLDVMIALRELRCKLRSVDPALFNATLEATIRELRLLMADSCCATHLSTFDLGEVYATEVAS